MVCVCMRCTVCEMCLWRVYVRCTVCEMCLWCVYVWGVLCAKCYSFELLLCLSLQLQACLMMIQYQTYRVSIKL